MKTTVEKTEIMLNADCEEVKYIYYEDCWYTEEYVKKDKREKQIGKLLDKKTKENNYGT